MKRFAILTLAATLGITPVPLAFAVAAHPTQSDAVNVVCTRFARSVRKAVHKPSKATLAAWKAWGAAHPGWVNHHADTQRMMARKAALYDGAALFMTCYPNTLETESVELPVMLLPLIPEETEGSYLSTAPLWVPPPGTETPGSSSEITESPADTSSGGSYYPPTLPVGYSSPSGGLPVHGSPSTPVAPPAVTPEPAGWVLMMTGITIVAIYKAKLATGEISV